MQDHSITSRVGPRVVFSPERLTAKAEVPRNPLISIDSEDSKRGSKVVDSSLTESSRSTSGYRTFPASIPKVCAP